MVRENFHEELRRDHHIEGSSNRSFGLVFTVAFAVLALAPLRHHHPVRLWAAGISGLCLVLALVLPRALGPLNALWMRLGLLLGRVVTPITLAVMFFGVFTPIGWIMRAARKNLLGLQRKRDVQSYWIPRSGSERPGEWMTRQF
jgi:hypothetical protein